MPTAALLDASLEMALHGVIPLQIKNTHFLMVNGIHNLISNLMYRALIKASLLSLIAVTIRYPSESWPRSLAQAAILP